MSDGIYPHLSESVQPLRNNVIAYHFAPPRTHTPNISLLFGTFSLSERYHIIARPQPPYNARLVRSILCGNWQRRFVWMETTSGAKRISSVGPMTHTLTVRTSPETLAPRCRSRPLAPPPCPLPH